MKTFTATPSTIKREWCVVDATDKTLGRLATELASRLRGKHKPEFTPNMDTGDHMVVINAEKIKVTGNKLEDKMYHRHTGYIGNLKSINLGKLLDTHPERVIQNAVKAGSPEYAPFKTTNSFSIPAVFDDWRSARQGSRFRPLGSARPVHGQ